MGIVVVVILCVLLVLFFFGLGNPLEAIQPMIRGRMQSSRMMNEHWLRYHVGVRPQASLMSHVHIVACVWCIVYVCYGVAVRVSVAKE